MADSPQSAPPSAKRAKDGLLVLHCGDGKGKTTAALGLAARAVGHGMKVCMVQFIKGKWQSGEHHLDLGENFEIIPMGEGFTWDTKDRTRDMEMVRAGWDLAMQKARSGDYRMLILDEFLYVLSYNYFPLPEVLDFVANKPANLHLILTGRNPPQELIDAADLVTEMKAIKHPYQSGIKAQKGIEF